MDHVLNLQVLLAFLVFLASTIGAQETNQGLDPDRLHAVAAMLPERPEGSGRPLSDRPAWGRLASLEEYKDVIRRAETFLTSALPEESDDLFLDFSRTGNRTRWESVASRRRGRLSWLVLAECLENKGRFLPVVRQLVESLCAERVWVMPSHDVSLKNFRGEVIDIDLASSALAGNLAQADWLLGDALGEDVRRQLRDNVRRRVLDPYEAMVSGARKPNWWMRGTSNWNAVCLAGVTGAGLAQVESREGRARYVVAAEKYSRNFLAGFTEDGYCSEGLGYWNYGFGHFVLLAETVRQATKGGVDLFALPEVKAPAAFGLGIEIINGVYPAFADCSTNARPSPGIMYFVNRRYAMGLKDCDDPDIRRCFHSLFEAMIFSFPNAASLSPTVESVSKGPGLRTWFDKAGVLIGRPAEGSSCRMGVALKGGHNAEHHNHNDVGSYVVVVGERPVLLDPGAETYTRRTFSKQRYEGKLLNSFGHPVPVVAGQLQRPGRDAEAKVLRADFTDKADTLQLDLRSAYPVPELKTLERTFVYSREGAGSLTVTDRVEFTAPQSFGTALITRGSWLRKPDGSLLVYETDESLQVRISASGGELAVRSEEIHEDAPVTPTRIGVDFTEPVAAASITLTIIPMDMTDDRSAGSLLRNGGFELGSWGWLWPKGDMGAVSTEQAASGTHSLKIVDRDTTTGSNISSARMPVNGAGNFLLRGKVFHVSGKGIGLYVKFYDAKRKLLNPTDAKGYIAALGVVGGDVGKWESFEFPFATPPGTTSMQLWIHSINALLVEAYLDDLEVIAR